MLRRFAAIGAPPLVLMIATLLLVRYHPLVLDALWAGRLPKAWWDLLSRLPLMLAAVGVVAGLRLRSCGIIIVMASIAVAAGVLIPGLAPDILVTRKGGALVRALVIVLPIHYLLGLWVLRHSWRSRRGLAALAAAIAAAGLAYGAIFHGARLAAGTERFLSWMEGVAFPAMGPLDFGSVSLAAALVAAGLAVRGLRGQDPLSAGLGASLAILLSSTLLASDAVSLALASSGAALAVLVGILESMFTLAYRDGLTGLPGRRGLNDALGQLGGRYAIAMLDVDHFKRFNDRFGHRTGDDVLKMVAARMRRIPGGKAFRYGGEEFAVLFTGRAVPNAVERMDRFREALAKTPFVIRRLPRADRKARGRQSNLTASRQQVRITMSVGLATPDKGRRKALEVLAAADKALYKAKKAGRNRVMAAVTQTGRPR